MNIQTTDAQGLFTKTLVDKYMQKSMPTSFLRSFFPEKMTSGLMVSIEVERDTEKVAVDVTRGTNGNRNEFSRSTEKMIIPPYFKEYFDLTQLQMYDRLYGATEISDALFADYINSAVEKTQALQAKIERAQELHCAQVLQTGIVIAKNYTIDYKRKAASMVDSGTYLAGASDPFALFTAGGDFLRKVGKCGGGVFNAILGSTAQQDLFNNTAFKARQNLFNMQLDQVTPPQKNSTGGVYHGTITAGPYRVHLWTYPQYYDLAGVSTPYIDPKKVIMVPENPHFVYAYAAVPQLLTPGVPPETGKYIVKQYDDLRNKTREMEMESAGVPVPTAVDQIYTFKGVA